MRDILFVCTGNTCRSSMAEALFKDILEDLGNDTMDFKVHSAGIFALENQEASPQALIAMKNRGINLSDHKSRLLTEKMVEEADLILTMTSRHKKVILDIKSDAKQKVYTLKEYAYSKEEPLLDITDPFGKSVSEYEKTANEIKEALKRVLEKMENFKFTP